MIRALQASARMGAVLTAAVPTLKTNRMLATRLFFDIAIGDLEGKPVCPSDLCRLHRIGKVTCSHALHQIDALINRAPDSTDNRRTLLTLSERGTKLVSDLTWAAGK
jgi:hypothetical protein